MDTFKLNEVEQERVELFKMVHPKTCKTPKRTLKDIILNRIVWYDSSIHYEFYPNEIGTNVYVVCDKCGKRKDVTDYNAW